MFVYLVHGNGEKGEHSARSRREWDACVEATSDADARSKALVLAAAILTGYTLHVANVQRLSSIPLGTAKVE